MASIEGDVLWDGGHSRELNAPGSSKNRGQAISQGAMVDSEFGFWLTYAPFKSTFLVSQIESMTPHALGDINHTSAHEHCDLTLSIAGAQRQSRGSSHFVALTCGHVYARRTQ